MKRKKTLNFRKIIERLDIGDCYIVKIRKAKNGNLVIPLPKEIVKIYCIKAGDIVLVNIIDKTCFVMTFMKKQCMVKSGKSK